MEDGAGLSSCASIAWERAWLQPWRVAGEALAQRVAQGLPLHEALNQALQQDEPGHDGPGKNEPAAPPRFVPQSELPAGLAYEQYIFQSGCCPVRAGLHDFFNGLCWLQFPLTKRRLNQLQAAEIEAAGVQAMRGAVRDALTLFDENAAFLQAPEPLWAALLAKDWQRLFVELRPLWAEARLLVFGHALLEKLVQPRKALTAHVYRLPVRMDSLAGLDAEIAVSLTPLRLAGKPFAPLPVLGVPGWWGPNADPAFYADAQVFRPARLKHSAAA